MFTLMHLVVSVISLVLIAPVIIVFVVFVAVFTSSFNSLSQKCEKQTLARSLTQAYTGDNTLSFQEFGLSENFVEAVAPTRQGGVAYLIRATGPRSASVSPLVRSGARFAHEASRGSQVSTGREVLLVHPDRFLSISDIGLAERFAVGGAEPLTNSELITPKLYIVNPEGYPMNVWSMDSGTMVPTGGGLRTLRWFTLDGGGVYMLIIYPHDLPSEEVETPPLPVVDTARFTDAVTVQSERV